MKLTISFLICYFATLSISTEKVTSFQEKTIYYFIRHAEKQQNDPTDLNPKLTKEGKLRAKRWSELFANKEIDFVFSTDFYRTRQTAKPIAESHHTTISIYDHKNLYDSTFQEKTRGKTSVVVGHSNTTPNFVNRILKEEKHSAIDETDHGKLFTVTIIGDQISTLVQDIP